MPRMTIYIRNADLEKWLAMKDKSEAVSRLINKSKNGDRIIPEVGEFLEDANALLGGKYNNEDITVESAKKVMKDFTTIKFCKHGYDPKLCKFAKGGKPCK